MLYQGESKGLALDWFRGHIDNMKIVKYWKPLQSSYQYLITHLGQNKNE